MVDADFAHYSMVLSSKKMDSTTRRSWVHHLRCLEATSLAGNLADIFHCMALGRTVLDCTNIGDISITLAGLEYSSALVGQIQRSDYHTLFMSLVKSLSNVPVNKIDRRVIPFPCSC